MLGKEKGIEFPIHGYVWEVGFGPQTMKWELVFTFVLDPL